jgi:hypothetical protein
LLLAVVTLFRIVVVVVRQNSAEMTVDGLLEVAGVECPPRTMCSANGKSEENQIILIDF